MRALVLVSLIVLALPAKAASNVLENEDVRLEVSSENGSILHLVDKHTNTDYVQYMPEAGLFRLVLPNPDYTARYWYKFGARIINSQDQKGASVDVVGETLTIHFDKLQISPRQYGYLILPSVELPEPDRPIEVTVTLRLQGSHVLGSIRVDNQGPEEISDVSFPILGGLVSTLGGQQGKAVFPSLSRKVISRPSGYRWRGKPYPGLIATAWLNYEFKDKGIGIEAQGAPETQHAALSFPVTFGYVPSTDKGASIGWEFHPNIPGQSQWTSPGTVIHVHGSDWHTIAGEHREWYRQRFSPSHSDAFDRAIGFATYRLKRYDNTVNWNYDDIPKLAEEAQTAGIRHLVITGWRDREGPGNPCPFGEIADPRMGGGPRLKALIESLHQQGVELAFAFHPTLVNTAAEEYQTRALRWTVKSRIGGNQLSTSYVFETRDFPIEDFQAHYWAQLDPTSPATHYLLQEARRLKEEYGFRNLFLRGVGLPSFQSYNQDTAVPPQKTYAVGYERFLGGLNKLFPRGLLFTEGFNDLVNTYASAGYTWKQSEGAEVLAFSLPWTPFSNDVEALDYDQANASFARKILINLIVDGGDGSVGRYVKFAKHLKALQRLKEATAPYYAQAEFRDHEGLQDVPADLGVMVSAFHNRSSQQMGVVVANLTKEKKSASFQLDEPLQAATARLFRLDGSKEAISLSPKPDIGLAPYEVAIVGIDLKH